MRAWEIAMADKPRSMGPQNQRAAAERLAIAALAFIAEEPERLGRFLALTGIGPESIRTAAHEPQFLLGVLDHGWRGAASPCFCRGKLDRAERGHGSAWYHRRTPLGAMTRREALSQHGAMPQQARGRLPGFCRDCRRDLPEQVGRCSACGSPRLLRHPDIDTLAIAHVDCDAFYAAIEKRDNPSLADQPVNVGGGHRGVVLTACYVTRTFGVRSAMPMFEARRLCPQATVVRPNMDKYARVGREVRELMFKLTPLVEPVSIDEAFMEIGRAHV